MRKSSRVFCQRRHQGQGCGQRRDHDVLVQRTDRGPDHQAQAGQASNVRTRQARLASGPPDRRYMTTAAPKLRQSQNCRPNDSQMSNCVGWLAKIHFANCRSYGHDGADAAASTRCPQVPGGCSSEAAFHQEAFERQFQYAPRRPSAGTYLRSCHGCSATARPRFNSKSDRRCNPRLISAEPRARVPG